MANDFSSDTSCVALYRFESGALTADSKGTNTLTDLNTVAENTVDYKEGACCADFELSNSESFYINDADLSSGFPLKSGATTNTATFVMWFKPETVPGAGNYDHLISKWDWSGGNLSFSINLSAGTLRIQWGIGTGTNNEAVDTGLAISSGVWYHLGVMIDFTTKLCVVRLYSASTASATTYSCIFTNDIRITSTRFQIGGSYNIATDYYDGLIDELVIFNRALSVDEVDYIRDGNYPSVGLPLLSMPLPGLSINEYTPGVSILESIPLPILAMTGLIGRTGKFGVGVNNFPMPSLEMVSNSLGYSSELGFTLPLLSMSAGSKFWDVLEIPVANLSMAGTITITGSYSGVDLFPLPKLVAKGLVGVNGNISAADVPLGILAMTDAGSISGSVSGSFPLPDCDMDSMSYESYTIRYKRGETCY